MNKSININTMKNHLCNSHVQGLVTMATKILERQSFTQVKDNPIYHVKMSAWDVPSDSLAVRGTHNDVLHNYSICEHPFDSYNENKCYSIYFHHSESMYH